MEQKDGMWVPGISTPKDINPSEYEPIELLKALSTRIEQIDLIVGDMRLNHGNSLNNLSSEFTILIGRLNTLESRVKSIEETLGISDEEES